MGSTSSREVTVSISAVNEEKKTFSLRIKVTEVIKNSSMSYGIPNLNAKSLRGLLGNPRKRVSTSKTVVVNELIKTNTKTYANKIRKVCEVYGLDEDYVKSIVDKKLYIYF